MSSVSSGVSLAGADVVLERRDELALIGALIADVRRGEGRLLVLEAPAGLGKSTLLEHAASAAVGAGVLALRAAGRELEQELGWGVARSLFESWLLAQPAGEREDLLTGPSAAARALLAPAEADGRGGAEASFAILHGLLWLAVRVGERGPLLLVVDDAHWADEPSLRFLIYLLGRVREQPIGVLVAARSGQSGAGGLLERLVADPAASVGELAPLSGDAVAALVRRRLPDADDRFCARCVELTAGNPLLVRELVAAVIAVPSGAGEPDAASERAARSLSRSVLARLGALSVDARELARAVAVFEGASRCTKRPR
jgi:predicted ATPase